jgi:predicted membrane protein
MNSINNVTKTLKSSALNLANIKSHEMIFVILLLLYLISNVSTPYNLAPHINNVYMYFSIIVIFIILLVNTNPLIALLFAIVAYVFMERSKKVSHRAMAQTESNKSSKMKTLNNHLNTRTLEEEMVTLIDRRPENITSIDNFNPLECDTHSASNI